MPTIPGESELELDRLHDRYIAAWNADIPSLPEIRQSADELGVFMAKLTMKLEYAIEVKPQKPEPLKVIRNEKRLPAEARGPSSPVKNTEIQELEKLARQLFGDSLVCSTEWR